MEKITYRQWQRKHPNFITPTVEKIERKGKYIIELSSGTGIIRNKKIFGVSLIKETKDGYETVVNPPKKAKMYIKAYDKRFIAEMSVRKLKEII